MPSPLNILSSKIASVNYKTDIHKYFTWVCGHYLCACGTYSLGFTNLFSLQGGHWVSEAVKAVFDVVPTLALQRIVVCPFVCLQWKESQGLQPGSRAVWVEDSGCSAVPGKTYTNRSAAKSQLLRLPDYSV